MIQTTLTLSLVTPYTFHPRRCCLQLDTVPLCEHPWSGPLQSGTARDYKLRCRRLSRYTRLDPFVVKHIALFLWTTNLAAVSVLFFLLHLSFNSPAPPIYTFKSSFSTPAFSAPPYCVLCDCVELGITGCAVAQALC